VTVTLDRRPDSLTITVSDDGQGAANVVEGNGIRGMRERAAELGGQLDVTSPGCGAGMIVSVVLPRPQSTETRTHS
jgi:signal transduction histidine kinase